MPDTVTMLDSEDGQTYHIPQENMKKAQDRGLKPAVMMTSPEGEAHWVPRENAARAIKDHGFTVGQAQTSDEGSVSRPLTSHWEATKQGAANVGRGAVDAVKGIAGLAGAPTDSTEGSIDSAGSSTPLGGAGGRALLALYRTAKGTVDAARGITQVPGAIKDISENPEAGNRFSNAVGETAGGVAVATAAEALHKVGGKALRSPQAEALGRTAIKAGAGVVDDIPVVRQATKLGKYYEQAKAETAARRAPAPPPEGYSAEPAKGVEHFDNPSQQTIKARAKEPGLMDNSTPTSKTKPLPTEPGLMGHEPVFPKYEQKPISGTQESLPLVMGENVEAGAASKAVHPDAAEFEKTFGQPIDNYIDESGKFNKKDFLDEIVKPKTEPPNSVITRTFGKDGVDLVNKLNGEPLAKWESQAPEGEARGGSARLRAKEQPVEPNWAYRARDVGEKGVPSGSHAQFTSDMSHAKQYAIDKEGMSGVPQEIVKVDLNKLKPADYTAKPGPRGGMWATLTRDLGEHEIGLAEEPKRKGPASAAK